MNITEAENAFRQIQAALEDEKQAKAAAKTARDQAKAMVNQASEGLKSAIEDPMQVTGSETEALVKLGRIEVAWQTFQDANEGAKELKAAAKDALKEARRKLEESIKETTQLGFAGF